MKKNLQKYKKKKKKKKLCSSTFLQAFVSQCLFEKNSKTGRINSMHSANQKRNNKILTEARTQHFKRAV